MYEKSCMNNIAVVNVGDNTSRKNSGVDVTHAQAYSLSFPGGQSYRQMALFV